MNDLGVSLHSHNEAPNFLAAMQARNEAFGGLEFDARYLLPTFRPSREDSPIVGIKRTIPRFRSIGLEHGLKSPAEPFVGTLDEFAGLAKDRLVDHIVNYWDADHPNLFCHSSGYDSRILSSCLAWLRDEGFDLGEVHFRCRPPEVPSFMEIMRRQGWRPDQYSAYEMPEDDPLDVGAWDRPGVSPWLPITSQINFWRDIVPYDREKDWNLIGGSGGGEALEYTSQGKPPTVPWTFCGNANVQRWFSYFPDGTDFAADVEARFASVMFPYFGASHIRTIAALPTRFLGYHPSGCDNVRAAILEQFEEDTLDVPRIHRTYSWSISEPRWIAMRSYYARSAFVREVPGAPAPDDLIAKMRADPFGHPGRIWRLAALWETVRGGSK